MATARKYYPGMGTGLAEVKWLDDEDLEFGDLPDVTVKWNSASSVLEFLPAAPDTGAVNIGNGTLDMDFQVFLGAADQHALFDVGNTRLTLTKVGMTFTGALPSHAIDFTGVVLDTDMQLIRGTGIAPMRTSGWIALQGTVDSSLTVCYPVFFQCDTASAVELLGLGLFMDMSAGASCKTLWGTQISASVASGATVLTAAGAPTIGVFAIFAKTTINTGSTFNAGGVVAAMMLSVQVNTVDVSGENSSIFNLEIASGRLRAVFYLKATGGAGATYLYEIADDIGEPASLTNGSDLNDISSQANAGWIKVLIGSTVRYLPLYAAKS